MSGDRHTYLNALARSPMLTAIVVTDGVLDAGREGADIASALPVAVMVVVQTRR